MSDEEEKEETPIGSQITYNIMGSDAWAMVAFCPEREHPLTFKTWLTGLSNPATMQVFEHIVALVVLAVVAEWRVVLNTKALLLNASKRSVKDMTEEEKEAEEFKITNAMRAVHVLAFALAVVFAFLASCVAVIKLAFFL